MASINDYMTPRVQPPGQPDWLRLDIQGQALPPDQAQLSAPPMIPPALQENPVPVLQKSGPNMSSGPATIPVEKMPMVNNFPVGAGLAAYMSPATKAMDRALIDQYKSEAERSMLEQQGGIQQLQQQRDDFSKRDIPIDWTPAAALVDSMNAVNGQKTNMAQAANEVAGRDLTQEKKDAQLQKFQEYIQAAKGNMSKESLEALKGQLQMIHQNDQANLMAQHYANEEANAKERNDIYGNRIQSTQEMGAQRQMLNDPINKTYIPRMDGAVKIMDFIDGAERGDYKTNKAFLGQMNAEIARLETGSQSPGLGAGEKTEMTSQAAALKDVVDGITGGVSAVDLSKKIAQARGMVGNLGQSYRAQIENRNRFIAAGQLPSQAPIFEAKSKQWSQDLDNRIAKLKPESAAALGIAPRSEDMVTVSNGKETLQIPRSHLAEALSDPGGYKQVGQ